MFQHDSNSLKIVATFILLRRPWIWKPLLILCQGEWKVASRPNSRPGNLFPLPKELCTAAVAAAAILLDSWESKIGGRRRKAAKSS